MLIALVVANRADEAIALMEHGEYDRSVLTDIRRLEEFAPSEVSCYNRIESPLGLYQITQANKVYFSCDTWSDKALPSVEKIRLQIARLERYWDKLGLPVYEPIDFRKFKNLCQHFCDDWSFEDLFDGTEEELVALGYDRNEVKMCYALLLYDKDEIERQIALGTNPDVGITGEFPPPVNKHDFYCGLEAAENSLFDVCIVYDLWYYWNSLPGTDLHPIDREILHGLFGAAAYSELLPRLRKLIPEDSGGSDPTRMR